MLPRYPRWIAHAGGSGGFGLVSPNEPGRVALAEWLLRLSISPKLDPIAKGIDIHRPNNYEYRTDPHSMGRNNDVPKTSAPSRCISRQASCQLRGESFSAEWIIVRNLDTNPPDASLGVDSSIMRPPSGAG